MTKKDYVIGIDLGTTNSAVAVVEGGEPTIMFIMKVREQLLLLLGFTDKDRKSWRSNKRQSVTNL